MGKDVKEVYVNKAELSLSLLKKRRTEWGVNPQVLFANPLLLASWLQDKDMSRFRKTKLPEHFKSLQLI